MGTGRSSGVRPKDLVGAIAGKSHLTGRDIGAIEIADRFSLVEVPEAAADDVVAALRQVSIKGRKTTVRRERYKATTGRCTTSRPGPVLMFTGPQHCLISPSASVAAPPDLCLPGDHISRLYLPDGATYPTYPT